jgi:hypothetical protein
LLRDAPNSTFPKSRPFEGTGPERAPKTHGATLEHEAEPIHTDGDK